jgi:hypothetical protein
MTTVGLIFVLLAAFNLKHFIADWLWQTDYHQGKAKRGWGFLGPLLSHVSNHFILTTTISAVVLIHFDHPAPFGFGMLIGLGDAVVHFIMDRIKAGPKYMGRWKMLTGNEVARAKEMLLKEGDVTTWAGWLDHLGASSWLRGNQLFWWSLGFDQAIHNLTNYAAIYAVLKIAGAL